jgi:histidinol phosphatase-like PHP family hydrolase
MRSSARKAKGAGSADDPGNDDTNARVGALLQDLAIAQTSEHRRWAYNRAADAILALDEPLESLVQPDGSLRKIPNVGPSSSRVVFEVLREGRSPTVDALVDASGRLADVERSRSLRRHFLSRSRVLGVLADDGLRGPRLEDYRGDFQMHSVWSDGGETLDAMIQGALARRYTHAAITDHSAGLSIARGMSMADVERQHQEIDALNVTYADRFRLLKGVEANIDAEGGFDLAVDDLARFEIVVAAPHSKLRIADDQTARLVSAISTPGVHILGHPRGRKYGTRAGIVADWDAVFEEAARRDVAIEIDGDPARQDIDFTLARRALDAGCLLALDSDAHRTAEFRYAEIALAHARLAGVPAERIVNCWNLDRLLAWARDRKAPRGRPTRRGTRSGRA